jgi:hypothetical protein
VGGTWSYDDFPKWLEAHRQEDGHQEEEEEEDLGKVDMPPSSVGKKRHVSEEHHDASSKVLEPPSNQSHVQQQGISQINLDDPDDPFAQKRKREDAGKVGMSCSVGKKHYVSEVQEPPPDQSHDQQQGISQIYLDDPDDPLVQKRKRDAAYSRNRRRKLKSEKETLTIQINELEKQKYSLSQESKRLQELTITATKLVLQHAARHLTAVATAAAQPSTQMPSQLPPVQDLLLMSLLRQQQQEQGGFLQNWMLNRNNSVVGTGDLDANPNSNASLANLAAAAHQDEQRRPAGQALLSRADPALGLAVGGDATDPPNARADMISLALARYLLEKDQSKG